MWVCTRERNFSRLIFMHLMSVGMFSVNFYIFFHAAAAALLSSSLCDARCCRRRRRCCARVLKCIYVYTRVWIINDIIFANGERERESGRSNNGSREEDANAREKSSLLSDISRISILWRQIFIFANNSILSNLNPMCVSCREIPLFFHSSSSHFSLFELITNLSLRSSSFFFSINSSILY